jgi:hypothetical protein
VTTDGGLRPLFRQYLTPMGFDWVSVESGTTGGGIPDSNYCARVAPGEGAEGWIEYKQTTGWAVTLRPEQIGWIARRVRHGGRVHVAVRQRAPAGPLRTARDVLWLIPGRHAVRAREEGLRAAWRVGVDVHRWEGGPSAWDWRAIAATLRD